MSGYLSGVLAILCINLIFAYGIFVPTAAGQINLGGAGFQAIGAYGTAWLSSVAGWPVWATIPLATLIAALIGFLISFPVLRVRGGTLFFTLLPEVLRIGGSWRFVVFGAAIVLIMALRPQGIVTRAMVRRLSPRRLLFARPEGGSALHGQ
jgi:ABC-type branched-subunit amino acid transport system permease subunit